MAITALHGVDNTTTVNVNASAASAAGLSHNAPSITTTVANTMLLTVHAMASSTTWTPPTGMTELVDLATNTAPDAAGVSFTVSRELRPTAGATGARTATANAGATAALGGTYTVALRSL